jgi:hypothetical protein
MAAVEPKGEIAYGNLEKNVQEAIPGTYSPDAKINFFKGQ